MNRIIASVGLVALGAASVQAQSSITGGPAAKWWSVQATVRGFYDDNINTVPHPGSADRVWGYELTPAVGAKFGNDQTTFYADYTYAFLYYDKTPAGTTRRYDQDHTFDAGLDHTFNERYKIHVKDTFVVGQEPDTLRSDNPITNPYRISGNNIVNSGSLIFDADITPKFGVSVGYSAAWYDYSDSFSTKGFDLGISPSKNINTDGTIEGSVSGLLNRIEQDPFVQAKWFVSRQTTALLGYQYGQVNYTGDEFIEGVVTANPPPLVVLDPSKSQIRDNRSHTLYVGVDHTFRPDLVGSAEAGASYYDYYNLHDTSVGPYARLNLSYMFGPESSAQIGFQEGRAATDIPGTDTDIVKDTETSVVYAAVTHRIIPHLIGGLRGTFQNSSFNGGGPGIDGKSERFYEFNADLAYEFSAYFSAHVGYDYDKLDSELAGRSYDRNKVYIGATARY